MKKKKKKIAEIKMPDGMLEFQDEILERLQNKTVGRAPIGAPDSKIIMKR